MAEYADETVQDAFVELEVAPPVQPDVESEATAAALETPPPEASLAPCHTAAVEPGTQQLEFTRGGSNKFWEITIAGVQHTVRFGRIGAKGHTVTKTFEDAAAARRDCERLIRSKLAKGYWETR